MKIHTKFEACKSSAVQLSRTLDLGNCKRLQNDCHCCRKYIRGKLKVNTLKKTNSSINCELTDPFAMTHPDLKLKKKQNISDSVVLSINEKQNQNLSPPRCSKKMFKSNYTYVDIDQVLFTVYGSTVHRVVS